MPLNKTGGGGGGRFAAPMKGLKRKRQEEAGDGTGTYARPAADAAAARLAKLGEAFMSSFDALPAQRTSRHPDKAPHSKAVREPEQHLLKELDAVDSAWTQAKQQQRDKASQNNCRAPPSIGAEAKRFMSGRADKVHTTGPSQPRMQPVPAEITFSRKDFLAAQKEAQQLGAEAMQGHSKRQLEAQNLAKLGMKAKPQQRMGAKIGLSNFKNKVAREQKAFEEAVAAGMVMVKGTRQKKQREARGQMDPGLREDGGAFKGGTLRADCLNLKLKAQKGKLPRRAFSSSSIKSDAAPAPYLQKRGPAKQRPQH